jgi:hypothetical protein
LVNTLPERDREVVGRIGGAARARPIPVKGFARPRVGCDEIEARALPKARVPIAVAAAEGSHRNLRAALRERHAATRIIMDGAVVCGDVDEHEIGVGRDRDAVETLPVLAVLELPNCSV